MKAETTFPVLLAPSRVATWSLRAEVVTDFNRLLSLAGDWSELEDQSSAATIFQTIPWIRAWWKAFGKGLELSTIIVRDGSSIVGILPLLRNGRCLRFIGTPGADYCDCLCAEEMGPEVLAAALGTLLKIDGWCTCHLGNLQQRSQFVRYASALPEGILHHLSVSAVGKQSSLVLTEDRDKWIAAMRRKPALKRHRNKLYGRGKVCFRHVETREEAHRMLRTLFEQHIYRRAMSGAHSQFLSSRWREFYGHLVDELDLHEQLRFSVLELNDNPLACHLGFQSRRNLVLYKPTFDIESWELSPGDVLLSELLGYAGERELDAVDFTIGSEQYKEHFTNYSSDIYCATLDRNRVAASLRQLGEPLAYLARRPASKRLLQHAVCVLDKSLASGRRFLQAYASAVVYRATDRAGQHRVAFAGAQPRSVSLADLVALAIHQPTPLNPRLLQEYRVRLRSGDRCYAFHDGDHHTIAWIRRIFLPGHRVSGTSSQSDVLYELRSTVTHKRPPFHAAVVEWFLGYARREGTLACICVPRFDHTSRAVVAGTGFCLDGDLTPIVRNTIWLK